MLSELWLLKLVVSNSRGELATPLSLINTLAISCKLVTDLTVSTP
jgi:hypothetical protein